MKFVYGDGTTKEIKQISNVQLTTEQAGGRIEVQVADTDPVILDPDPYKNWRLSDDNLSVELELRTPKIYDRVQKQVKNKHFHDINYRTEVLPSLYAQRTMVQGEVQLVEWFSDSALTDKILKVEIVYNRDAQGFAINRFTTRTWINKDESENPDTKITEKRYDINIYEQLVEGQTRRHNLANNLSMEVLGQMQVVLNGTYTPDVITQKGRDFLLLHSVAWAEFVKSSHQQIITDVSLPDLTNDEWLLQDMVPGTTIKQYIIDQLTLY